MRGATRIDIEKIVPTTRRIAVVVLKGADEGKAKRAIERLNRERDKLIFHEVNEPEEMPGDADLVVVFANGTTEGAR
ncbi:TPA: hypothetical protein EYP38_05460, partial [Candidatus Micrarchaeota archaeon]|nr:hypothetical protein [Candidatus Micrarchaeota archaeon]